MVLILGLSTTVYAEDGSDEEGKVTTDDGILILQSKDGRFKYQLDARLYLDAAYYQDDKEIVDLHSGSEVRRMRFAIKATLWKDWLAEIDLDFAENAVDIKDAWMGYQGVKNMLFKVGQFRSPFSLEELTTSRYISFIERGLPNAFPPGRLLGFGISKWGKNWQVSAGIFGQEAGDIDEEEGENSDEGISLIGRFSIAPFYKNNKILHLGASYAYRGTDAFSDTMRFRGYDESRISKIRFLNTGKVKEVDHVTLYGLESVLQIGSFHLQGEYLGANVARLSDSDDLDYTLKGGYVFASFFLSGDSMPYLPDAGEFGRIIPKKKGGAFELLARYSWVDLNDLEAGVEGGEGKNFTLGFNWYINANYKIMINYTHVNHDQYADADGDWQVPENGYDYDIFAIRFLVTL
jgi:phosphate-selective porin OprO/OprP